MAPPSRRGPSPPPAPRQYRAARDHPPSHASALGSHRAGGGPPPKRDFRAEATHPPLLGRGYLEPPGGGPPSLLRLPGSTVKFLSLAYRAAVLTPGGISAQRPKASPPTSPPGGPGAWFHGGFGASFHGPRWQRASEGQSTCHRRGLAREFSWITHLRGPLKQDPPGDLALDCQGTGPDGATLGDA